MALLPPPQVQMFMEGKQLPPMSADAGPTSSEKKKEHNPKPLGERPVKVVPNYQVSSIQVFDDMLDKGVAVENVSGGNGSFPKPGDEVVVKFKAHLWDCQIQSLAEFLASEDKDEGPMEFIVDQDPTIIKGLHMGVMKVPVGGSGRIIIAPKVGYGVAGFPPAIPPMATLVYDVNIVSAGPPKALLSPKVKPTVKARVQDAAPRVMSMKLMAPLLNRGGDHKAAAAAAAAASAAPAAPTPSGIVAAPSTKEHAPTRRAGHVVVSTNPAPASAAPPAAAPAPAAKPKYSLDELKTIVKTPGKLDELGLDRNSLEDYLTDEAFFEAFLVTRGNFLLKPEWRRQALKRAAGLA